jgi:DNA-binding SARP family transcriptional activator
MAELQIHLLGPPEIRWNEQLLNINRRIPRTLLFYLASQANLVGRGKLATFFWEEAPTDVARRRLREALSRIRAELPDSGMLVIHNDLVGLDADKAWVDQSKFLELQDSIGNQPWIIPAEQPLPEKTLNSMILAASLWRGSQFIEGAELPSTRLMDDWWRQTNLYLTSQRTRLLARICDHYRISGQPEEALKLARKALESDNLNEDLHQKVLTMLVDTGQYQEARQYYSFVVKLLNDELDTQPSQQLVSIYRQIRKRTVSTLRPLQPDWRILASVHTPFVGRQNELNRLHEALDAGGGLFLTGESGLGKTRLVHEFCELFASNSRIFLTHCRPAENNLPYQPIIEFLRNQINTPDWQNLSKVWAESLGVLLAELLPYPASPYLPVISLDKDYNRSTLLEAIRQVFLLISQQSHLVLFMDDVQWADEASLSAISYLAERPPFDRKALIILAARSDEINPNLENFRASINTSPRWNLIELERLHSKEISGLGRYVMGYPLDQNMVDRLEKDSGGNPFIILETLRSIQAAENYSGIRDASSLPLPKTVYSLIKNRLERLSPLARETAEYAAVIGLEFDPEIISFASQQNLSIIARAIEELKQRNFIDEFNRPPADTGWRFIHEKIRETILLDMNPFRLRFLHAHVASAMEANLETNAESQAAVLANHYELAGNATAALNYWLKAAQWARQLYSAAEARQIFSRAERLMFNSNEAISDELIHDIYAEWTEMAYELQDAHKIRDLNSKLLRLGRERRSQLLIGTALDGISDASLVENQFEEGLSYTTQAISWLNQTDNTYELMDTHIHHGVFLYMLGRINEAIQSFELALSFGDKVDDPQIQSALANAYYQLGFCQTLAGWPEIGFKNATLSLNLANRIGHHHTAITAYTASSLALYFMADYDRGRRDNQKGIALAERIKENRFLGYLYAIKGFLDSARGDLGAAYESAQFVYKLGEEFNHQDTIAIGHRILGDIFLLIEAYDKACEYFQKGVDVGGYDFWGLDNLVRLGYAQISNKKTEVGLENLHRGIELAQSAGLGIVEIRGLQFLSYSYISLKEWNLALQVSEKLSRQASKRSLPLVRVLARFIGGIAESNLDQKHGWIEQLQFILNALDDIEQPFITIRVLTQLVRIKKAYGLDADPDLHRIKDILTACESDARPKLIKQEFLEYRKSVLELLSG